MYLFLQNSLAHLLDLQEQLEDGPRTYQSAGHPVHHDALWQVHGVGNGQDHEPGLLVSGPVKEIVHYVLFLSPQKVKLPGN